VVGKQVPQAENTIIERAAELDCTVIRVADHPPSEVVATARGSRIDWQGLTLQCPFAGAHQVDNTITAALALRTLGVTDQSIGSGIARAVWPGRLEFVSSRPDVILDGAHNPSGARALAAYIEQFYHGRKVWLIYGTMRDKSIGEIVETLFPLAHELILT